MYIINKFYIFMSFICLISITPFISAQAEPNHSPPQSISTSQIKDFNNDPEAVKNLITTALSLANENLTYKYGSDDPKEGGMDCSGTIHYLLTKLGIKDVPRQADTIYQWAWQQGHFYAVNSSNINSFEFEHLKPGDLLFWSGTYNIKRDPPITHVMFYLGKNLQGQALMFGASDGRIYERKYIWGVSVFDFNLPPPNAPSRFLGYSCIPLLNCNVH